MADAWAAAPTPPPATPTTPADENGPPVAGRLRTVPVAKTFWLTLVTLGIYLMVRTYKNSGDLHRMPNGDANWQVWFWLRFIPWAGIVFVFILHFKNNKQANLLRTQRNMTATYAPFILSCIPFVNIAAPFVWAGHYNELARRT